LDTINNLFVMAAGVLSSSLLPMLLLLPLLLVWAGAGDASAAFDQAAHLRFMNLTWAAYCEPAAVATWTCFWCTDTTVRYRPALCPLVLVLHYTCLASCHAPCPLLLLLRRPLSCMSLRGVVGYRLPTDQIPPHGLRQRHRALRLRGGDPQQRDADHGVSGQRQLRQLALRFRLCQGEPAAGCRQPAACSLRALPNFGVRFQVDLNGTSARVHAGFLKAWQGVRGQVLAQIQAIRGSGICGPAGCNRMIATGHSLGAAVAGSPRARFARALGCLPAMV
jgi:hypothetical protein